MRVLVLLIIPLCGLIMTGCSKIPTDDDFVSSTVANRIDSSVEWINDDGRDEQICKLIENATVNEMTADLAIQIALVNNPKVRAIYADIGIARADLVEAGLLCNPSFAIEIRYPPISGLKTNIEYLISSSLLDIFLIPLRTRLAKTEFEQTKLKVSNEILSLAFDVRETFYDLISERKKNQYTHSKVELTGILSEISSKQVTIGNVDPLEFHLVQARLLEDELNLNRSQAEVIHLTEKLYRLLGLKADIKLTLPENLPDVDDDIFDLNALKSCALTERLDLQIAKCEINRLSQMLGLKDGWTYTGLTAGLAGERDPDGTNLIGPGFSGEIPLFNYGQAARMRIYAQLRQAYERLDEMEVKVLSEVSEAYKRLMSYRKIIHDYRTRLLPIQNQISAFSEELYNVMGLGIDKLLENKRQEVAANQYYTESLKQYWIAKVELDRALGGCLCKLLNQMESKDKACQ